MDTRVDALRRWQALDATARRPARLRSAWPMPTAARWPPSLLRDCGARRRRDRARAGRAGRRGAPASRAPRARWRLLQAQALLARGDAAGAAASAQAAARATRTPAGDAAARRRWRWPRGGAGPTGAASAAPKTCRPAWPRSPHDATAWSLLGRVWARLGQPLRALRAEAEAQYALGDLRGAVDRLRAGQRLARSRQCGRLHREPR